MEKNTVNLSLIDYNELRDFKIKIETGNIFTMYERYDAYNRGYRSKSIFCTKDSVIEKISKENDKLIQENDELHKFKKGYQRIGKENSDLLVKIMDLTPKPIKLKEKTIEELKQMGFWELRKWQKENKSFDDGANYDGSH